MSQKSIDKTLRERYEADTNLTTLRQILRPILLLEGVREENIQRLEDYVWISYRSGAIEGAEIALAMFESRINQALMQGKNEGKIN